MARVDPGIDDPRQVRAKSAPTPAPSLPAPSTLGSKRHIDTAGRHLRPNRLLHQVDLEWRGS
jgi:hypothetical protein